MVVVVVVVNSVTKTEIGVEMMWGGSDFATLLSIVSDDYVRQEEETMITEVSGRRLVMVRRRRWWFNHKNANRRWDDLCGKILPTSPPCRLCLPMITLGKKRRQRLQQCCWRLGGVFDWRQQFAWSKTWFCSVETNGNLFCSMTYDHAVLDVGNIWDESNLFTAARSSLQLRECKYEFQCQYLLIGTCCFLC